MKIDEWQVVIFVFYFTIKMYDTSLNKQKLYNKKSFNLETTCSLVALYG